MDALYFCHFRKMRLDDVSGFSDIQCRIGLYNVITSLVTHCHYSVAPPTTCVTHLLTIGLQDAKCQVGLINCLLSVLLSVSYVFW